MARKLSTVGIGVSVAVFVGAGVSVGRGVNVRVGDDVKVEVIGMAEGVCSGCWEGEAGSPPLLKLHERVVRTISPARNPFLIFISPLYSKLILAVRQCN